MDDKLKIFWNLEVLVKMSRSKNDGPSLRIEELEIEGKIKSYRQEIEEIESISEEENYDTSAEMADRNIEIITKKQIQVLRSELKEKNKELTELKNEEKTLYEKTNLLRENKNSQERYIESMQERVGELVDVDILDRYNGLIAETTEKVNQLTDELEEESTSYNSVQEHIIELTDKIKTIEEEIAKKKSLLSETQAHLENKDNYIDHTKTEKNAKRIKDLEGKVEKLESRLEVLRQDPQYLESKIKDIINNKENKKKVKPYLVDLINQVIRVPYINVPADNFLEEELLRATQARDSFANEIDGKTYNILEADTPEKLRIEFLTDRISKWREQLDQYSKKIAEIDHDEQFNYERKERILSVMINSMKNDVKEFERAYEDVADTNIGAKASIKAALDEKREDLVEAEKIATLFRKDEADDIARATRTIKYECDQLNKNIAQANDEIQKITNRLTSKKSGLIDISTRNKDKDTLKEIAQIVIDIKHRRQFPETPIEIIERLEEDLNIDIKDSIDMDVINSTRELTARDYEEYYQKNNYDIEEPEENYVEEIEEEQSYEQEDESVDRFNEAYDKLINEEESEEAQIEKEIDEFYDENDIVADHSGPEDYQEEYTEEPVTEEVIEEEIPIEEEVIIEEQPEEITEEVSSEVEEIPVYEETEEVPVETTEEQPVEETQEPVEEVATETPEVVEEVVEVPTEEPTDGIFEPVFEETPAEEIIDSMISDETPVDASVLTEPTEVVETPPTEEVVEEPAPVEPITEESTPEQNPFADITPEQMEVPAAEEQAEEPIQQVVSTDAEFGSGQLLDSNSEVQVPQQEFIQNVEEPVIELTPEAPLPTEEGQIPLYQPDIPPVQQEEPVAEYQDIVDGQADVNVADLLAPEVNPQVIAPDGNEYIELSSDVPAEEAGAVMEPVMYPEPTVLAVDNAVIDENVNTEVQNSDNIYSSDQIENELDNYISSLEEENS